MEGEAYEGSVSALVTQGLTGSALDEMMADPERGLSCVEAAKRKSKGGRDHVGLALKMFRDGDDPRQAVAQSPVFKAQASRPHGPNGHEEATQVVKLWSEQEAVAFVQRYRGWYITVEAKDERGWYQLPPITQERSEQLAARDSWFDDEEWQLMPLGEVERAWATLGPDLPPSLYLAMAKTVYAAGGFEEMLTNAGLTKTEPLTALF